MCPYENTCIYIFQIKITLACHVFVSLLRYNSKNQKALLHAVYMVARCLSLSMSLHLPHKHTSYIGANFFKCLACIKCTFKGKKHTLTPTLLYLHDSFSICFTTGKNFIVRSSLMQLLKITNILNFCHLNIALDCNATLPSTQSRVFHCARFSSTGIFWTFGLHEFNKL